MSALDKILGTPILMFFMQYFFVINCFLLCSDNGKDFGGSIYQKVSEKIDCGISMKWTAGSADTLFGVGTKFALDADASLHAKINNKSLIGLGYQQKLRPGGIIFILKNYFKT